MSPLHHSRVMLTFTAGISEEELQRHTPASAQVVGEELAEAVQEYVRDKGLGYYPALDYFQDNPAIEVSLLEAVGNLSWLAGQLVRNEVTAKLRPVFANVKIEAIRCTAYTLPRVRPKDNNAFMKLAQHYAPDAVKVDLQVTVLQKHQSEDSIDKYAQHIVLRWLKSSFESLELGSAKTL